VGIAQTVDGFRWVEGIRDWRNEGALEHKVQRWKEAVRIEQEAEAKRRRGRRWADDAMEVDEEVLADSSEDSEDDEDDTAEVKALKVPFTCIYPRTRLS
jgi:protein SMG6